MILRKVSPHKSEVIRNQLVMYLVSLNSEELADLFGIGKFDLKTKRCRQGEQTWLDPHKRNE